MESTIGPMCRYNPGIRFYEARKRVQEFLMFGVRDGGEE